MADADVTQNFATFLFVDGKVEVQHSGATDLGPWQMAAAVGLMLLTFIVSRVLDLKQDRNIAIASFRTIVQLSALGYILLPIFTNNKPYVVIPWVLAMSTLAAREAWVKPKYVYPGMFIHVWLSICIGLGLIMAFATWLVFKQSPWWDARIFIPICGMLLGNTMNNITLSLERFLTECSEGRDKVELYLTRGASPREAILPAVQTSINVGITPTLNTMNVIGLVSLPGMMTGQILGGGLPVVAAKYQVMIMFLISGNGICTMFGVIALASRGLFDKRSRLQVQHLQKRQKKQQDLLVWALNLVLDTFKGIGRFVQNKPSVKVDMGPASPGETTPLLLATKTARAKCIVESSKGPHSFVVKDLSHAYGNEVLWRGVSFGLQKGSTLIITGPNGCGKSTLLRILCDLQEPTTGTMELEGRKYNSFEPTEWRCRVLYLQQGNHLHPSGTPQQFLSKVKSLRIRQRKTMKPLGDPIQLSTDWGLARSLWDQEWNSLSGGESQRLHLAIALTSNADVLLLDEPFSACDPMAVQTLEAAILEHPATKIIITHDEEQAVRLAAAGGQRLRFEWADSV